MKHIVRSIVYFIFLSGVVNAAFHPDTLVSVDFHRRVPIYQLCLYDEIPSYDLETKCEIYVPVSFLKAFNSKITLELSLEGEFIYVTPDQLFYDVFEERWIPACTINAESELLTRHHNTVTCQHIRTIYRDSPGVVIGVEDTHTFFVGLHEVVVHNCAPLVLIGASLAWGNGSAVLSGLSISVAGFVMAFLGQLVDRSWGNKNRQPGFGEGLPLTPITPIAREIDPLKERTTHTGNANPPEYVTITHTGNTDTPKPIPIINTGNTDIPNREVLDIDKLIFVEADPNVLFPINTGCGGEREMPEKGSNILSATDQKQKEKNENRRVEEELVNITNKDARKQAKEWGYKEDKTGKFSSHGELVFKKGRKYISPDADGHGGSRWKLFDKTIGRIGSLDKDGNKIRG